MEKSNVLEIVPDKCTVKMEVDLLLANVPEGVKTLDYSREYNKEPNNWYSYHTKDKGKEVYLLTKNRNAWIIKIDPNSIYRKEVCKEFRINKISERLIEFQKYGYRYLEDRLENFDINVIEEILDTHRTEEVRTFSGSVVIGPIHAPLISDDQYRIKRFIARPKNNAYYFIYKNMGEFKLGFDKESIKKFDKMNEELDKKIRGEIGPMFG